MPSDADHIRKISKSRFPRSNLHLKGNLEGKLRNAELKNRKKIHQARKGLRSLLDIKETIPFDTTILDDSVWYYVKDSDETSLFSPITLRFFKREDNEGWNGSIKAGNTLGFYVKSIEGVLTAEDGVSSTRMYVEETFKLEQKLSSVIPHSRLVYSDAKGVLQFINSQGKSVQFARADTLVFFIALANSRDALWEEEPLTENAFLYLHYTDYPHSLEALITSESQEISLKFLASEESQDTWEIEKLHSDVEENLSGLLNVIYQRLKGEPVSVRISYHDASEPMSELFLASIGNEDDQILFFYEVAKSLQIEYKPLEIDSTESDIVPFGFSLKVPLFNPQSKDWTLYFGSLQVQSFKEGEKVDGENEIDNIFLPLDLLDKIENITDSLSNVQEVERMGSKMVMSWANSSVSLYQSTNVFLNVPVNSCNKDVEGLWQSKIEGMDAKLEVHLDNLNTLWMNFENETFLVANDALPEENVPLKIEGISTMRNRRFKSFPHALAQLQSVEIPSLDTLQLTFKKSEPIQFTRAQVLDSKCLRQKFSDVIAEKKEDLGSAYLNFRSKLFIFGKDIGSGVFVPISMVYDYKDHLDLQLKETLNSLSSFTLSSEDLLLTLSKNSNPQLSDLKLRQGFKDAVVALRRLQEEESDNQDKEDPTSTETPTTIEEEIVTVRGKQVIDRTTFPSKMLTVTISTTSDQATPTGAIRDETTTGITSEETTPVTTLPETTLPTEVTTTTTSEETTQVTTLPVTTLPSEVTTTTTMISTISPVKCYPPQGLLEIIPESFQENRIFVRLFDSIDFPVILNIITVDDATYKAEIAFDSGFISFSVKRGNSSETSDINSQPAMEFKRRTQEKLLDLVTNLAVFTVSEGFVYLESSNGTSVSFGATYNMVLSNNNKGLDLGGWLVSSSGRNYAFLRLQKLSEDGEAGMQLYRGVLYSFNFMSFKLRINKRGLTEVTDVRLTTFGNIASPPTGPSRNLLGIVGGQLRFEEEIFKIVREAVSFTIGSDSCSIMVKNRRNFLEFSPKSSYPRNPWYRSATLSHLSSLLGSTESKGALLSIWVSPLRDTELTVNGVIDISDVYTFTISPLGVRMIVDNWKKVKNRSNSSKTSHADKAVIDALKSASTVIAQDDWLEFRSLLTSTRFISNGMISPFSGMSIDQHTIADQTLMNGSQWFFISAQVEGSPVIPDAELVMIVNPDESLSQQSNDGNNLNMQSFVFYVEQLGVPEVEKSEIKQKVISGKIRASDMKKSKSNKELTTLFKAINRISTLSSSDNGESLIMSNSEDTVLLFQLKKFD